MRPAWTSRPHSPNWPGWPSGSRRARRSSTGSWSSSTAPVGPIGDELARRLRGEPGRPVAFLAFDLLHLDGRSLLSQPLVRRREALRRVLRPGDEVVAVPAIATEGIALFEAVVAQGVAGILARQRQSPYLPGVRSRLWRFIAATPAAGRSPSDARRTSPLEAPGPAAAPVLALISRLPLEDEPE